MYARLNDKKEIVETLSFDEIRKRYKNVSLKEKAAEGDIFIDKVVFKKIIVESYPDPGSGVIVKGAIEVSGDSVIQRMTTRPLTTEEADTKTKKERREARGNKLSEMPDLADQIDMIWKVLDKAGLVDKVVNAKAMFDGIKAINEKYKDKL